jgi:hypothetical protein
LRGAARPSVLIRELVQLAKYIQTAMRRFMRSWRVDNEVAVSDQAQQLAALAALGEPLP